MSPEGAGWSLSSVEVDYTSRKTISQCETQNIHHCNYKLWYHFFLSVSRWFLDAILRPFSDTHRGTVPMRITVCMCFCMCEQLLKEEEPSVIIIIIIIIRGTLNSSPQLQVTHVHEQAHMQTNIWGKWHPDSELPQLNHLRHFQNDSTQPNDWNKTASRKKEHQSEERLKCAAVKMLVMLPQRQSISFLGQLLFTDARLSAYIFRTFWGNKHVRSYNDVPCPQTCIQQFYF